MKSRLSTIMGMGTFLSLLVHYSHSAPSNYECSEEGLTQLVLHPSYPTYIPAATSALIACKTGLNADPNFECDWDEPADICNNDVGGQFFVFIKRVTCPDGSSFTLYPNCVPASCNVSEARAILEDTFLSDLDPGCNGEVTVLYGVIGDGSSSQPSIAPAPAGPGPGPVPSPTTSDGVRENALDVALRFSTIALVLLSLVFA